MSGKYVRKTIYLDQEKINKIIRMFNVKTEKDAVNKAMEIVTEDEEIIEAHRDVRATGKITRVYK